jgi:ABC-type glycerol-3-phosphate transport system substrate-binding protein
VSNISKFLRAAVAVASVTGLAACVTNAPAPATRSTTSETTTVPMSIPGASTTTTTRQTIP